MLSAAPSSERRALWSESLLSPQDPEQCLPQKKLEDQIVQLLLKMNFVTNEDLGRRPQKEKLSLGEGGQRRLLRENGILAMP